MHEINWWGLGSQHADSPALGWYILTFAIFLAILYRAIKKPLALFLERRSEDIGRQLEEARAAKKAAEDQLRQYEGRLKSLDQEISDLKRSFAEQGQREKVLLEDAAHKMAEQIKKDAQGSVQGELHQALLMLRREFAVRAVELARKELSGQEEPEVDEQLRQNFSRQVAQLSH